MNGCNKETGSIQSENDWPNMHNGEIKLRAERRAGEMLKEQEMNKGGTAEKEAYR